MKIKDRNDMVVLFKSLNVGDVLLPASGSYCMKIEPIDEWESESSAQEINVIYLRDGVDGQISPKALVKKSIASL